MDSDLIEQRFSLISWALDEKLRRLVAAAEAKALGRGGISTVSHATGVSRRAIHAGLKELESRQEEHRKANLTIRHPGGGRKKITDEDSTLLTDLESLLEPSNIGDATSPTLRWTIKGLRSLAKDLEDKGHKVSHAAVGNVLKELGYTLHGNIKTQQGSNRPDRDSQFVHINTQTARRVEHGHPVISLNVKKLEFSKSIWVTAPADHQTQVFAVQTIRCWWRTSGSLFYPHATDLLIVGDGGGDNGPRKRLWKLEIQKLADEIGIPISFSHFPAGTYKWTQIDNRVSASYSIDRPYQALARHEILLNPITRTADDSEHQTQKAKAICSHLAQLNVPDEEFSTINIVRDSLHRDWNYTIYPREKDWPLK
ncbi:MAG: ISAzo13 family transposase [Actinomycetota bacterium]|nr:MAG: ISAzo13 family transposase [Actinomycetota bacterium]